MHGAEKAFEKKAFLTYLYRVNLNGTRIYEGLSWGHSSMGTSSHKFLVDGLLRNLDLKWSLALHWWSMQLSLFWRHWQQGWVCLWSSFPELYWDCVKWVQHNSSQADYIHPMAIPYWNKCIKSTDNLVQLLRKRGPQSHLKVIPST